MVMSAVGYPDTDPHNKTPKYCTKCRKHLKPFEGQEEYDAFTGVPIHKGRLICPTLNGLHDNWVQEKYGVWTNYRQ